MTQPPPPDWSARLALTIAGEVRRHRQAQGLSAQQLAERCATIGMPIQRSVLANLESGRRTTVTVAEVLVLAHALNVPPGVLIFPVGYETQVEVLPEAAIEPGFAVEWLAGRTFLDRDAADGFFDTPLGLVRLHHDEATSLRRTVRARDHARQEFADIADRFRGDEERYVQAESERARVDQEMEEIHQASKRGERLDLERFRANQARHNELVEQAAMYADGARQYRYAAERVQEFERSVAAIEERLRGLRERMKSEGLRPPLLPRVLSYIDPELPSLEDFPEKKVEIPPEPSAPSLEGAPAELNATLAEEESAPLSISPDLARSLLEEMKPYIAEIITEAMKTAMQQRREKEDD